MVVVYLFDGRELDFGSEPASVETILLHLDINPVEVLVSRNGELVPESETARGNDVVRVYRISHGG